MYKLPSARRRTKPDARLNLIPILDAVFILIFFLLMSAQFLKIYDIGSDLPLMSEAPPPTNQQESLNLTIRINNSGIGVWTGMNLSLAQSFKKTGGLVDLGRFHQYLIDLKKRYPQEFVAVVEPSKGIPYDFIVKVLDSIRQYRGTDKMSRPLFNQIVFGNLSP